MELIKDMAAKNNQTIVMVTHDVSLASYADKIIRIKDGHIESIEEQNKDQVVEKAELQADSQEEQGGRTNENS